MMYSRNALLALLALLSHDHPIQGFTTPNSCFLGKQRVATTELSSTVYLEELAVGSKTKSGYYGGWKPDTATKKSSYRYDPKKSSAGASFLEKGSAFLKSLSGANATATVGATPPPALTYSAPQVAAVHEVIAPLAPPKDAETTETPHLVGSNAGNYMDMLSPKSSSTMKPSSYRYKPSTTTSTSGSAFLRSRSGANTTHVSAVSSPTVVATKLSGQKQASYARYNPKIEKSSESTFLKSLSGANTTSSVVVTEMPTPESTKTVAISPKAPMTKKEISLQADNYLDLLVLPSGTHPANFTSMKNAVLAQRKLKQPSSTKSLISDYLVETIGNETENKQFVKPTKKAASTEQITAKSTQSSLELFSTKSLTSDYLVETIGNETENNKRFVKPTKKASEQTTAKSMQSSINFAKSMPSDDFFRQINPFDPNTATRAKKEASTTPICSQKIKPTISKLSYLASHYSVKKLESFSFSSVAPCSKIPASCKTFIMPLKGEHAIFNNTAHHVCDGCIATVDGGHYAKENFLARQFN